MATIFDPENEKEQKEQAPTSASGQPLQTVATAAPQPTSSMASPERRGSGRFTNLQKYLQANQQAGQRIAGKVGEKVQSDVGKEQQEAQDYYSKLGQSVSQAQQNLQPGTGFTEQLRNIGQNIQSASYQAPQDANAPQAPIRQEAPLGSIQEFTQNPQFQQFQNIQAGRAVDEARLGLQQQQATREAQEYLQGITGAQQALGSAGGRFDLLRQTFGGAARPGYTTGQQRLDQLFLSGGGGLRGLQEQLSPQLQEARSLSQQVGQRGREAEMLQAQEKGLMGEIAKQTAANEQAYKDMLQSYVDPTQTARDEQYNQLREALQSYQQTGQASAFTPEQLANLGITGPTQVFDVLQNINLEDIATPGQRVTDYRDIAGQADVDRYAALAQMAGLDPSLSQAGDLGSAYGAKEGESSLANRIAQRREAYEAQLQQQPKFSQNDRYDTMKRLSGLAQRSDYLGVNDQQLIDLGKRLENNPTPENILKYFGRLETVAPNIYTQWRDWTAPVKDGGFLSGNIYSNMGPYAQETAELAKWYEATKGFNPFAMLGNK
jgi:hypothetical protein